MREMLRAVQHKEPIDAQRVGRSAVRPRSWPSRKERRRRPRQRSGCGGHHPPAAVALRPGARSAGAFISALTRTARHGNDPLRMLRELAELGDLSRTRRCRGTCRRSPTRSGSLLLAWHCRSTLSDARSDRPGVRLGGRRLRAEDSTTRSRGRGRRGAPPRARDPSRRPRRCQRKPRRAPAPVAAPSEAPKQLRPRRRQLDPRQHREGRRADQHRRRARDHAGDAEPARPHARRRRLPSSCAAGLAQLERNMRDLQESVMRVRMLPISSSSAASRAWCATSRQRLGKQVELQVTGEETELDKAVVEKIGDPLMHLVRNSVDHGIEMPAGAPRRGQAGDRARASRRLPPGRQHRRRGERRRRRPATATSMLAKARERGLVGRDDVADRRADLRS